MFKSLLKSKLMRAGVAGLAMGWIGGSSIFGQTIQNPSFEADAFRGTINSNTAITGWVGSPSDRVGIDASGGTYANNGATPDGARVAFLQSTNSIPATLSTVVSNLTIGQTYTVNFRLNAGTNQTPNLKVAIDSQSLVNMSTLAVQASGATAAYRYAAFDFTATAAFQTLWLTNDASTSTTATIVLVDNFTIALSTSKWSYAWWTNDASSGVDNTKAYTHAYNFGGTAAPDTVINGITFKGYIGANPTMPNEFSITGLGSQYTSDDANVLVTAGGGSAALAKRFIYGGNPGYFIIGDLVPGLEYVATFYTCAWETGQRAQTLSYGNDRMTINQDQFNNDQGIRISYRYTAPSNGAITLLQTPLLPANTMHTYGFANHEASVNPLPVVGLQPRSQVTTPGSSANFSVTVGGSQPLSLQWFKDGNPISGQNNRFLTLNSISSADLGGYSVVVTNLNGAVTSLVANLTFGPIANPSFEADVYMTYPGYASGNKPISGWTGSSTGRVGVNPYADNPVLTFASNGNTPDGNQVGFLQGANTNWISTILNGLTPGQKYTLSFRANGRTSSTVAAAPIFHVVVDGQWLVDSRVSAVGVGNAYRYEAMDFTPTTASPVLYITNDAAGDYTVLLDDFKVVPSTTHWSMDIWTNDASSGVDGSMNFSHAYNFGGSGLTPETTINGVKFMSAPGANPAVAGQFSTAGYITAYTAADSNVITLAGGGSAGLAQCFIYYGGSMPYGVAETINISNLVPGVEYVASIYAVAWDTNRINGRGATFSFGADRQTFNLDQYGQDIGVRVSYRYIADDTGSATLSYVPNDAYYSFHTYAFANYEVNSTNAPMVYNQPRANQAAAAGGSVTLYGLGGGQAPLSYLWEKDGVALANQTNRTLLLTNLTDSDTGIYNLILSNANGVRVSSNAAVDVGLPIVNNSFEVDTFATTPGYVSGNAPITGWTSSITTGAGLNPISTGASPFANNGTIPDGTKVAFLQADGEVLSQFVSNLVIGSNYIVKFYENSRSGYAVPSLSVTMGGTVIVPSHTIAAGSYRQVVSDVFTATDTAMELDFVKAAGPAAGDSTVLLDYVVVLKAVATPPVFVTQPQGAYLNVGDSLTLSARATGLAPIGYQWLRNGFELSGQTASTLTLNNLPIDMGGNFTVVASNAVGSTTSLVALVVVGLPFTDLFNTGVDNSHALLPANAVDPHYQMIQSADAAYPGPDALVLLDQYPIDATHYMSNGPASKWLTPMANVTGYPGNAVGNYTYRTSFVLDDTDPTVARLEGKSAVDNWVLDVLLNGVSLGISNTLGFTAYTPFVITNNFVQGSNVVDVVVSNGPTAGPIALRMEWTRSLANPLVGMSPQILSEPASRQAPALGEVSFTVLAYGSGPIQYQWYYEGFDLPYETNRTLHLSQLSEIDQQGNYWVYVYNDYGDAVSDPAMLTIASAPAIVEGPISQSADCSGTAMFSVSASSEIPYGYVWYHDSARVLGQVSSTLVLQNLGAADAGVYTVVITNWAGSATSAPAMLTVMPRAPVIQSCAPSQTLAADTNGQTVLPDLTRSVVVSPTCSPLVFAQDPPAGTVLGLGTTNVLITITDTANTSVNCSVNVTVEVPVAKVNLAIVQEGTHAVISWPASAGSAWKLWGAEVLAGPSSWSFVTNAVIPVGDQFTVTVDASTGRRFFRLQNP